mgnify:CR=1 FL=1
MRIVVVTKARAAAFEAAEKFATGQEFDSDSDEGGECGGGGGEAVSYTHLTLPTILLV